MSLLTLFQTLLAPSDTPNVNRALAIDFENRVLNVPIGIQPTMPDYISQADGIPLIIKAPAAVLDYTIDWAKNGWLAVGEYIVSSTVTPDTGITVTNINPLPVTQPTKMQIWLSGGTAGTKYLITCTITTSGGRTDQRSFRVQTQTR